LSGRYDRSIFNCGIEPLDFYLKNQAGQDIRRNLTSVFVLLKDNERIVGYYALSQSALTVEKLPEHTARKLPRKREVACTLLGRLAVDLHFQSLGFGRLLLCHALNKALAISREIASFAVIVDVKDDKAKSFYLKHNFLELEDMPYRLFIPIKGLEQNLKILTP
jgi:GNAT superfamily N-acetyltransferase